MNDGLRWSPAQLAAYEQRHARSKAIAMDVGSGNAPDGSLLVGDSSIALGPHAYTFTLPLPPSVNSLYGVNLHTGEKFLTPAQRQFRADVVGVVALSGSVSPLAGRLELRVALYQTDARRQDISNRIKALEDALAHAGAFHDDSQIDKLSVERRRGERAECLVQVREIG